MSTLTDTIAATLAEHEARWTTHGYERPYDAIHCAGGCDWSLRQKVSMSNDDCYDAHRAHVADILAADFTARLNAERARNGQAPPQGWLS